MMVAISEVTRLMDELKTLESSKFPHVWCDGETLVVGSWPNANGRFDFSNERFQFIEIEQPIQKKHISLAHLAQRDTGSRFEIETRDAVYVLASAVQTLLRGLEIIEQTSPGTLDKMCELKGRSKRPVGHTREALYDMQSQRQYAEKIATGHFVATNNKALESLNILRKAARIGNLSDDDFVVRSSR